MEDLLKLQTLVYNGKHAVLQISKTGHVTVKWFTPHFVELKKWRIQFEPLLAITREYCNKNGLTLWSY